jgi:protein-tyrosine phosphatase
MSQSHPRHIHFESAPNFRDLGGDRTHDGRTVAWRRLFRSAALHKMNDREMVRLKQEVSPRAVIDLRSPQAPERNPEVLLIEEIGARYLDALEIIAERDNHPLVFHCSAGKDRTGVLAAMVLTAMGIVDEDVVADYTLSAPLMKDIRARSRSSGGSTAPPTVT